VGVTVNVILLKNFISDSSAGLFSTEVNEIAAAVEAQTG